MCGIVGALAFRASHFEVSEPYLERMRDVMEHRGPDACGVWVSPNRQVGLAHRRLSIIDLSSAATQPMSNADGTLRISFNGEIYNHMDIRRELDEIAPEPWRTDHSDTETLMRAYQHWGIDCLAKLRGMFAMAIWNEREQALWLIRDRLGIKPLYYSIHHGRITFASEIKALLEDPEQEREVDLKSLGDYLAFLVSPPPRTMFEGIHKLPAATWLRVSADGQVREHKYWDVWENAQASTRLSDDDAITGLLANFTDAVKLHKAGDVPVGLFLSGGLDSSLTAALFAQGESSTIRTFSIGYDGSYGSYRNELHFARQVAGQIGSEHHEQILGLGDLRSVLTHMIRQLDEPLADPVTVPGYYLSLLARKQGVKVCQVGEGADELFWGYSGWTQVLGLQRLADWPLSRFMQGAGLAALKTLGRQDTGYYELLRRSHDRLPIFWGGAEGFTAHQRERLAGPVLGDHAGANGPWESLAPIWREFKQHAAEPSAYNWMRYLDLCFRLPELLLMRTDKMSMAASLETRVPFLDHKVVEFAMGLPLAQVLRQGEHKWVLKKAASGLVPRAIVERKKQGFRAPIDEWYQGAFREEAGRELKSFCSKTGYLDWAEVEKLVNSRQGQKVWYLLCAALWWKHYITGDRDSWPSTEAAVGHGRTVSLQAVGAVETQPAAR